MASKVNQKELSNLSEKAKEDYKMVQLAIAGDQQAYAQLMARYRHPIYHLIYKMVNNKDDADDLTLEAFGKAFNKLSSYAPRYAFSTWLFKIATNNTIDHIRKKKMNLLSIDDTSHPEGIRSVSMDLKTANLNPEERIIRQQKMKLMRQLIKKLNLKYRLMIELRYFEGLTYEQIANELDVPLGTVKAQLYRAKQILCSLLDNPGAEAYIEKKTS